MTTWQLILVVLGAVVLTWACRPARTAVDASVTPEDWIKHPIQFYYGPGGSITCDENAVAGSERIDDGSVRWYGHRYLVCESVSRESAEIIVKALGGVLELERQKRSSVSLDNTNHLKCPVCKRFLRVSVMTAPIWEATLLPEEWCRCGKDGEGK